MKISLADLVNIRVWGDYEGNIGVSFDPIDPMKNVIVDEKALENLNGFLTEKLRGQSAQSPNAQNYIKEYCHKWLDEFHRLGYIELEDVKWDD